MTICEQSNVVKFPVTGRLRSLPRAPRFIMVVDDHPTYPGLLRANLNILHNYATDITLIKSLGRALDELRVRRPDLLFVSDSLRPASSFAQTERYVRQAGYTGPIIACALDVSLERRHRLTMDGANFILTRDDTHTAAIIDLLTKCFGSAEPPAGEPVQAGAPLSPH
jgi:CheY-like chemotaxis protein